MIFFKSERRKKEILDLEKGNLNSFACTNVHVFSLRDIPELIKVEVGGGTYLNNIWVVGVILTVIMIQSRHLELKFDGWWGL